MTFSSLPFINLLGKKGRSSALFVFAMLLSFSLFGGALILTSLKNGLKSLELRLGADIIVVPYEARTKVSADTILNQGNRTYFYMSKSNLEKVSAIEGVERVSPQIYMCSMNAGCCSVSLQVIGFDPETDFTIQPWVRQSFREKLGDGDILIGSKVTLTENRKLRFFDKLWNIAAQLEETGTGLDNAIFANVNTVRSLMTAAEELGYGFVNDKSSASSMISTIMVKVADGYDIDSIASQIQRKVRKTQAVKAKSMTSGISDSLSGFSKIIGILTAVVWFLCLFILAVVSTLIINERKKEFAILRVMGASQKKLSHLVMAESLLVNAAGGFSGILLALLFVLPFHTLIKNAIALPFLFPKFPIVLALLITSLALSVLFGCLTASYAAHKISKVDTGVILREGN
mgnify:CR=1 FL=1